MVTNTYYHINGRPNSKSNKLWLLVLLPIILLAIGGYYFLLTQSPNLKVGATPNEATEKKYKQDEVNYLKIEKINVLIPLITGENGQDALNSGAWHRLPERGDPTKGGNFIICANYFELQLTPGKTKAASPFYHLNKLAADDTITIFYDGSEYNYKVGDITQTKESITPPDQESDTPKLTLYSCNEAGNNDGDVAVQAAPMFSTTGSDEQQNTTPLL